MTLAEFHIKLFKANLRFLFGSIIGVIIAPIHGLYYTALFGVLFGLLISLHLYKGCVITLIEEFKRLKTKENDENENFS